MRCRFSVIFQDRPQFSLEILQLLAMRNAQVKAVGEGGATVVGNRDVE